MAKKSNKTDDRKTILEVLSKAHKRAKDFLSFADDRKNDFDVISSGYVDLDRILTPKRYEETGHGGVPRGFLCEFFGPEAGGKSSLCMMLAADVTKRGGKVLWVDAEGSWVDYWAKNHGVCTENVIIVETGQSGEEYIDIMKAGASSGHFELIVLDSMASIQPKDLQSADLEKEARIGALARLMHRACPQLSAAAKQGNCSIVIINQVRDKIVMFGNPETTPGGRSLKFYASLRLRLAQVSSKNGRGIIKDDEEIGIRSNVRVVKSRFGPPYVETVLPIYYSDVKPHPLDLLLDMALASKIIRCRSKKDPVSKENVQTFTMEGFDNLNNVMGIDEFKIELQDTEGALQYIVDQLQEKGKGIDADIRLYLESIPSTDNTEE